MDVKKHVLIDSEWVDYEWGTNDRLWLSLGHHNDTVVCSLSLTEGQVFGLRDKLNEALAEG